MKKFAVSQVPPPDDNPTGKTVAGKYRVEQMIGEGGMGKVYKATQLMLDKPVVLKVLRPDLLSDDRTVARFQREAKAASRLNHPNSISILDFGQAEDGAMYIAMEYVHGKDLHHILSREWPLPEARVAKIMSQVLSALSDAHTAGVIHRDLKPENIMVEQRRGDPDFVKVLDFGIAKIQDDTTEEGPALTKAGFVCGTPEYMSPEQARGAKIDHRSDLYAVGVILYQLAAGVLPFESESAIGFATKHLVEQPIPPSKKRPDARISPAMERLIMRAMSKAPEERPQTAEAFRAELLAIEKERRAAPARQRATPSAMSSALEEEDTRITNGKPKFPPGLIGEQTESFDPDLAFGRTPKSAVPAGLHVDTKPDHLSPPDITAPNPSGAGSGMALKVVTIILVAVALGLAGTYGFQQMNGDANDRGGQGSSGGSGIDNQAPLEIALDKLPEAEIPVERRDTAGSAVLEAMADTAWAKGQHDVAVTKYQDAFVKNPTAQLALKLGELQYQKDKLKDAERWWNRHLKERADSKAAPYIRAVLGAK
jgi:serine/threonine-protein kinase